MQPVTHLAGWLHRVWGLALLKWVCDYSFLASIKGGIQMRSLNVAIITVCCGLLVLLLAPPAGAKPDKVDGVNVPSGRVPQEIVNGRYPRSYFPNTEKLGSAEMRIIALGTGMPTQSPSNKSAAFLVELGNGDSFLFDLGTGSTDHLAALQPDYSMILSVVIVPLVELL